MFKTSYYIESFDKSKTITDVYDAGIEFKNSSRFFSDAEYTAIYNNDTNTFDIYQLIWEPN